MALKRSRAHQQSRAQRKAAMRDKMQVLQIKVKEEEAVDWDYDYAEDSDVSFEPVQNKRKRQMVTKPYEFNWEQEGELVDWYRANPELYDKDHRQFRNTRRRFMMLEEKAKEFPGCTCDQLCQFYKSQRTMYGRLTRRLHKSGSGRKFMTERQQWIVEKWGFINDHIVRVERKQSTRKFNKERAQRAISSEDELDSHEGPSGSTTPNSQERSMRRQTIAIPTAASSTTATSQQMIKEIMQQAKATTDTMNTMIQPKTSHERIVETFSAFLTQEMLLIPESEWVNFSMEVFALARAHRFPQPNLMQHMVFMGHPQMGMMAPPHQHAHHVYVFYPQAMMGPQQTAYPPMASQPNIRAPSSTPHQAATTSTDSNRQLPRRAYQGSPAGPQEYSSLDTPITNDTNISSQFRESGLKCELESESHYLFG